VIREDAPSRTWAVPVVVWGTLLVVLVHALVIIAIDGRNMPEAEDWLLVPPLTGNEPSLLAWLWRPNAEHRVALPKLVYLIVLKLSGGDFRSGMVLNTVVLAALAAACVRVSAALRGRTSYADAFFPLLFLNVGEANNFAWGWQFQYVSAVALTLVPLFVIVRHGAAAPVRWSAAAALCVALLPLTGANGLIYTVALAPWCGLVALRQRAEPRLPDAGARAALFGGGALAGMAITAVSLLQYQAPSFNPPNPGPLPTVITALKFAAMALGPAVWEYRALVALVLSVAVLGASALVMRRVPRALAARDDERWRLAGLVCFVGGCLVLTAAMGYGRAAWVPMYKMPARYALLAVPTVVAAWYAWELYGPPRAARIMQTVLLALSVFCIPANYRAGYLFIDWMRDSMDQAQRDIDAGIPRLEIARRNRENLLHWDEPNLGRRIGMLRDAGIGPFAKVKPEGR
jgi:hypothetical protein